VSLRILMVTSTFPPRRFGGVTGVSFALARKLAQRGHQVTVYTTDAGDSEHARLKVENVASFDGLEVHYFRNISNLLALKYRLFTPISCLPTLRSEINHFDIVHFHDYRSLFSIFGSYFAKSSGIPYVIQAHGSVPKAPAQQKGLLVYARYVSDTVINEGVIRNASRAIALTQSEALAYENVGVEKGKVVIIPNGLDLSQFAKLPARGQFRERYGIESHEKIVLFLARINKIKGLALLLNAFCGLEKEVEGIRLVIAGPDDGYLAQLKEDITRLGITDKVLLTGPLYNKAKLEAYVDADAYVLPSSYDTFPLTVIEACACGAPTIVTNRCGVADAIREVGYVVDYDTNQLQSAIHGVVTNAALRETMKERGPVMVRERYDLEKIIDDLESLYRECV
jgi:glycosyltransferase involved in cell wall biosynthesis